MEFESIRDEKDNEDRNKILSSLFYSAGFILILWVIHFIKWSLGKSLSSLGVLPGSISGLTGIFTAPLIHADISHLASNSFTLLLLLFGIFYFYRSSALKVFVIVYIFDGILVWLFARKSYHIGASGLVYGFASFLFFSGVFRKDKRSIALALLIVFLYGGMVWGVLPVDPKISFESHLFGAVTGLVCAFIFRKNDPPQKYDWEDEEYEEDDDIHPYENDLNGILTEEENDEEENDEEENDEEDFEKKNKTNL